MLKSTYNYLWNTEFQPLIRDLEDQMNTRFSADRNYGFCIIDLEQYKKDIFDSYITIKEDLKKYFFYNSKPDVPEENLIDIHKIASCFCKAMIKNKVCKFRVDDEKIPFELILSNYTFAFFASIGILYQNMLADYRRTKYESYLELQKRYIVFPKTNPGHDSFALGRIKTLALNDIYGLDFDLLAFSDMFFWIEEYNKRLYR